MPLQFTLTTDDETKFEQVAYSLTSQRFQVTATWNQRRRCGTITLPVPLRGRARFLERHQGSLFHLGFDLVTLEQPAPVSSGNSIG